MIEAYVGSEPFRGGVNAYLELHAYDNATTTRPRKTSGP